MFSYKTLTGLSIYDAYEIMLNDNEYPYLVHCRNYIPSILSYADDVQVYQQFNSIRKELFINHSIIEYPTACAVGSIDSQFRLSYIRSDVKPVFFSNPNQTDAFKYPSVYGTPQFSRAAVCDGKLFISGTASIIGSETKHIGAIASQTLLSLDNIHRLISVSGVEWYNFTYTTYVKHDYHIPIVKKILDTHGIQSEYVNVDICRDNLLVEIEVLPNEAIYADRIY